MRILIYLFILFVSSAQAGDIPLNTIREQYKRAATNEDACKNLISISEKYKAVENPTMAAYNACATMMMAKHVYNPFSKLSYFNKGKKLLEKCINANNENIEIRFLRFAIQTKSPSFLGYNNSIEKDKLLLLKEINSVKDLQLKQMIISFLKSSEHLNLTEKQNLKS